MSLCVCGSGLEAEQCCLPILNGKAAPTAEALMRSRYAAYVLGKIDHIARTNADEAAEEFDPVDAEKFSKTVEWLGLDILRTEAGGPEDETGIVDFTFHFRERGQALSQREVASFVRKDGAWLYQTSDINPKGQPERVEKIGRNDPCSCGSGKKYKKCCGA